ncbi:MAG: LUD domain-containing protein [Candidatus Aenigmarchaeota archaeon]|nr:LUD domain-containing protein [Candidatus Aenigmarchaeota archaeon]
MDLKKVLASERIKFGKELMEQASTNYMKNRDEALRGINEEELKEKVKKIKEFSIVNLESLKKKAIENLEKQKIKVFEAKDAKEACEIALRLIPKNELIVKSKSNTIKEIGLLEILKKRNKLWETDCGDFIVQITDERASHTLSPALHIPIEKITQKIKEKFGVKLKEDTEEITNWIKEFLRKKIIEAKIGLTGANFISADGAIFIVENEGNISLVSRLPEKHIIFAGIDKIVPTLQDAITLSYTSGIWGSGVFMPSYINVIGSPSKTADVKKELIFGMHGAKEVYLILVDNGRKKIIEDGLKELLYCINCGGCLYFCPVYRQVLDNYGFHYIGGRGVGMTLLQEGEEKAFDNGLYYCTTCQACKENCPFEIDIPELMRKLRKRSVEKGLETSVNERMMENIRAIGNPFGEEVKEGKIPKELFCC